MSYQTGTSTSYRDLLSKLKTFLEGTPGWTTKRYTVGASEDELIIMGPGSVGGDELYVGIKTFSSTPGDYFNWECRGFTGYVSGNTFEFQPGISPKVHFPLWNQTMTYWFIGNGRRVIVVVKVSTVYVMAYLGWFLPYGTPGQWPYPLYIAASMPTSDNDKRWSATGGHNHNPFDPGGMASGDSGSYFYDLGGTWRPVQNWLETLGTDNRTNLDAQVLPVYDWERNCIDASYIIHPCQIITVAGEPSLNVLGELEGVGRISHFANAAENDVTVGGDTWLVVPDVFRTGPGNLGAVNKK